MEVEKALKHNNNMGGMMTEIIQFPIKQESNGFLDRFKDELHKYPKEIADRLRGLINFFEEIEGGKLTITLPPNLSPIQIEMIKQELKKIETHFEAKLLKLSTELASREVEICKFIGKDGK